MHVLHIWEKVNSLTESQCCINPRWLSGVPQGSIPVSFMLYVIVGKAFAESIRSTAAVFCKGLSHKKDAGFMQLKSSNVQNLTNLLRIADPLAPVNC